jgi:hypothetical protein
VVLNELLTWFAALRVCAAVLAVESISLGLLSFLRRPTGIFRVGAIVALAAAIGVGVLARDIWVTYQDLLALSMMRSYPLDVGYWYLHTINQTIPFYETAGRVAMVGAGLLLVAGLVLMVKAIRGGPTSRQRVAGPSQGLELPSPT